MCAVALRERARKSAIPGAIAAPHPGFIEPCDPTLREQAPSGDEWLHEIKSDGYRAQLHICNGGIKIYTRTGLDWTHQFAPIAHAADSLAQHDVIIDGEATVQGSSGRSDYEELRRELARRKSARLVYHAFDLLYLDGFDLRRAPLIERKRALEQLLAGTSPRLSYVEHIHGKGQVVFDHACRLHLEGVVSKRSDAPYRSGRSEAWIKLKCKKSDTYPIIAFVEKLGASPRKIASLYVGRREGDRLLYAGKVRTGYTEEAAREVRERLDPLIRKSAPLSEPIVKPKATWVEPTVEAEVEYSGITDNGILREAVFKGLREDLMPKVRAPRIVPAKTQARPRPQVGVPQENILQLLPDAVVPSKEQLAAYWKRIWKKALPYLGHRPLKLVRHVNGTTFYHKGPLPEIPAAVHQLKMQKREGGEGTRLWVDDLAGLLGLVEIGAVELHPWNASVDDIERANQVVFDLDPGDGVEWEAVMMTALKLRGMLKRDGFDTWPKLTGGKGLHVMAPLGERDMTHDQARLFARRLVETLAAADTKRYVLSSAPGKRTGRIFLDYLRNGRGTTAVGTYSPRARQGLPIAAPVTWEQVEGGVRADAYSIDSPLRAISSASAGAGAR
jgi:bifunctional non-homologous end joining protein LigD